MKTKRAKVVTRSLGDSGNTEIPLVVQHEHSLIMVCSNHYSETYNYLSFPKSMFFQIPVCSIASFRICFYAVYSK